MNRFSGKFKFGALLMSVLLLVGLALPVQAFSASAGDASATSGDSVPAEPQSTASGESPEETGASSAQQGGAYTLVIRYISGEDGAALAEEYRTVLDEGEAYAVDSPEVEGWLPELAEVSGVMSAEDKTLVVQYTQAPAKSGPDGADTDAPAAQPEVDATASGDETGLQAVIYTLRVVYIYEDGSNASEPFLGQYHQGEVYTAASPSVAGYYPDIVTVTGTMGDGDYTITVHYLPAQDNTYRVQHLFETLDGGYVEDTAYPMQQLEGPTAGLTNAQPHNVTGFVAGAVNQTVIAADSGTLIQIQYQRVTNFLYFVTGGDYIDPIELKYGETVLLPTSPTKAGYTFTGWYTDAEHTISHAADEYTMGATEATLYADWTAAEVSFRRIFWLENANEPGEYLFYRVTSNSGVAATQTEYSAENLPVWQGFTMVRVENVQIAADGSSVVNIYYDRDEFELRFYRGFETSGTAAWSASIEEEPVRTIRAKYGADINDEWLTVMDEVPGYRWVIDRTDMSADWTVGYSKMSNTDVEFYGVPNGEGHTYHLYYMYEILDQDSGEYDRIYNGVKYKEYAPLTKLFTYVDHTCYITESRPGNVIPGYTYDTKENFDRSPSVTVHNGYYYFKPNVFNLSFTTDCGVQAPEEIEQQYGTAIQRPVDPVREGYTLLGWYLVPGEGGTEFVFATMPGEDTLLYAHWAQNEYTVSFNLNDGGAGTPPGSQRVSYMDRALAPTEPERAGYTFLGWYENSDLSGSRFVFDKPIAQNTVLYAKWISNVAVEYLVKYTKQDGTPYFATQAKTGLEGQTLTEQAPVDNNQKYLPDAVSKSILLDSTLEENVVEFVYRPFTTLAYRVEHRFADGGELLPATLTGGANPVVVTDSEYARIVETPLTVSGYTADATSKSKILSYEVLEEDIRENVIVFYYTETGGRETLYTVTFDFGFEDRQEQAQYAEGDLIEQPDVPLREQHTLNCWKREGTAWDFAVDTMPAMDITLAAEWAQGAGSISSSSSSGGTSSSGAPSSTSGSVATSGGQSGASSAMSTTSPQTGDVQFFVLLGSGVLLFAGACLMGVVLWQNKKRKQENGEDKAG